MGLLDLAVSRVKNSVSNVVEAQRFISRHKLKKDPEIPSRYYLSAARDRYIDADLSDPDVRASAEEVIRNYRITVRVRSKKSERKKQGPVDTITVDTSCLRFVPPSSRGKREDDPPF